MTLTPSRAIHAIGVTKMLKLISAAYFLGANQASVTSLPMMCRCTLLHCGQANVRKLLRTLVLCVEHVLLLSVGSPEFPGKPTCGSRFHGVARNDFGLYGVTLRAFEPAMFKAHRTRANARKHHARCAARTSRALDACE